MVDLVKMKANNIRQMDYVDFMATLDEINRPPGGKDSIRILVQNTFLNKNSHVLDIGCNTGYCSFEIAELAKCKVTGLDINKKMVKSANKYLHTNYPDLKRNVRFIVGDGTKIPFKDNTFDLVMSGGSTAFIPDIPKALLEYARVTKQWGFVGDINFYYHTKQPKSLIRKLNDLMKIDIQPWNLDYWQSIYRKTGLEIYYHTFGKMTPVSNEKIEKYCSLLTDQKPWDEKVKKIATERLIEIMTLFNENHRYLAYGVFILRKRSFPEITLF
ncbi:MAG: class I SAM-dependent methyltransferase [Patescibacteria group bacterium]